MKNFKEHLHESGFWDYMGQKAKQAVDYVFGEEPFPKTPDTTPGPFSQNAPAPKPQTEEDFEKSFGGPGSIKSNSEVFQNEPMTAQTHEIKKGDTLWDISGKNQERVNELMRLNKGINPNKLQIGQRIRIK